MRCLVRAAFCLRPTGAAAIYDGAGESMKSSGTGKVLAVLFLGVLRGVYSHFNQMQWLGRGRDAYLADQGRRFDNFAAVHSAPAMFIAGIILVAISVGLYELIAAGFTKIIPPSTAEE